MRTELSFSRTSVANSCRSVLFCVVFAAVPASVTNAQSIAEGLPISLDADSSIFDRRNNQVTFSGLRISQGAIGVEADSGVTTISRGANLDFADSVWKFAGNVRIDIESARIRCDAAELYFRDHTLQRANVEGQPAQFNDAARRSGLPIEAEANKFEYDLTKSEIRFSGNARIAEGDNEVTGADLLYDIDQQRVNFRGDSDSGERVKITIVPEDLKRRDDSDR